MSEGTLVMIVCNPAGPGIVRLKSDMFPRNSSAGSGISFWNPKYGIISSSPPSMGPSVITTCIMDLLPCSGPGSSLACLLF